MEILFLKNGVKIYYDKKRKMIGRHPTGSNTRESGSDNSVYMGLNTNKRSVELICDIMGLSSINEFDNMKMEMSFYGEPVEIQCNINDKGHLQYKVVGNGKMHKLVEKYEKNVGKINKKTFLILFDIKKKEMYFDEYDKDEEKHKDEFNKIVSELKNYKQDNVDVDGYIEAKLTVRNNHVQRIFRENLLFEFECQCALCGINEPKLLHASHILPYSKCNSVDQMIDHYNGLLLCALHDELFDKRFISFDKKSGLIIISKKIDKKLYDFLNIRNDMKLDKKYLNKKRIKYLSTHNVK